MISLMQLSAMALRRDSMIASIFVGGVIDFSLPFFVRDLDLVITGDVREIFVAVGGGVWRKAAIECGEGDRLATRVALGEGDGEREPEGVG